MVPSSLKMSFLLVWIFLMILIKTLPTLACLPFASSFHIIHLLISFFHIPSSMHVPSYIHLKPRYYWFKPHTWALPPATWDWVPIIIHISFIWVGGLILITMTGFHWRSGKCSGFLWEAESHMLPQSTNSLHSALFLYLTYIHPFSLLLFLVCLVSNISLSNYWTLRVN